MKKQLFGVFTVFSFLFALRTAPGYGQTSDTMKANIPFDFIVGKTALPAGTYTVERVLPSVLLIRSEDTRQAVTAMTHAVQTATRDEGKLIFNRYGNQYFLSQVLRPGSNQGRVLIKSRREEEIAAFGWKRDTVAVAITQLRLRLKQDRKN